MTSNAGASRIGRMGIGFKSEKEDSGAIMEEVKRLFQPEFRNRLDRTVVFKGMDDAMAGLIVDKKLRELSEQLKVKKIELTVDEKLKELVKKRGISAEYGARQLDRVIRSGIKPLFVDELLFGSLKDGGKLSLTVSNGEFAVEKVEGGQ